MSDSVDDRLLVFEVAGEAYALPISGVAEVIEVETIASIPTLPAKVGGVINFHGDALPVVRATALFATEGEPDVGCGQVLAITDRPTGTARLGMPVDRVIGLVQGASAVALDESPVAERRSIDGRVTGLIDPRRLVERATATIEQTLRDG